MNTHYQITIVKYGTRQATKSDVFLNHHIYDDPDEPLGMDYFVWVVQNSERSDQTPTYNPSPPASRPQSYQRPSQEASSTPRFDWTS